MAASIKTGVKHITCEDRHAEGRTDPRRYRFRVRMAGSPTATESFADYGEGLTWAIKTRDAMAAHAESQQRADEIAAGGDAGILRVLELFLDSDHAARFRADNAYHQRRGYADFATRMRKFHKRFVKDTKVTSFNDPDFASQLKTWFLAQGWAHSTMSSVRSVFSKTSRFAFAHGLTETNVIEGFVIPAETLEMKIKKSTESSRNRDIFLPHEMAKLLSDRAAGLLDRERRLTLAALDDCRGDVQEAAKRLKIHPTTLRKRLQRWTAARHDPVHLFVALCSYAGLRGEEACNLDWTHVDLDSSVITIPAELPGNKNRRIREATIFPQLREILVKYEMPRGRVCEGLPMDGSGWRRAFDRYCRRVGLDRKGRQPHSFRRTCISALLAIGWTDLDIMNQVGHEAGSVTQRYSTQANRLRPYVAHWGRVLRWRDGGSDGMTSGDSLPPAADCVIILDDLV